MNKNLLKQTFRYLWRNKLFSFVNIAGLSISLALVFLLSVYISTEKNVDRNHTEKIYRLTRNGECAFSPPFGQYLKDNVEGVESYCRVFIIDATLKSEYNLLHSNRCYYADSNFFKMFSLPLEKGKEGEALASRNNVMISQSYAAKLFPDKDPVGKTICMNNRLDYVVKGVFKDFDEKTHFKSADVVFPFNAMGDYFSDKYLTQYDWHFFLPALYLTAKTGYDLSKSANLVYEKSKPWYWLFQEEGSANVSIQPVEDIYFNSAKYAFTYGVREGNAKTIRLFTFIVIGILVIALINYINLTISYSVKRRNEIGIKKIIGSSKKYIIYQSLIESAIFFVCSFILGLILILFVIPAFNRLSGYHYTLQQVFSVVSWVKFIFYYSLIGLITGNLIALILSGFKPSSIIKKPKTTLRIKALQRSMVVLQYVISIVLIISVCMVLKQNSFLVNYNVGFDKTETFFVRLNSEIKSHKLAFKEQLQKVKGIESVSLCNGMPGVGIMNMRFTSNNQTQNIDRLEIDEDYFKTMGITTKNSVLPDKNVCWINKSAAKSLNYDDTQRTILVDWAGKKETYIVNEVLPDMNFHSLYTPVQPAIFTKLNSKGWVDYALVRVNTSDLKSVLTETKNAYRGFCKNFSFDYSFVNDKINSAYKKEFKASNILLWFSVFAIFISSLGIFTMSVFSSNIRIKEIGIRKVNGAKIGEILSLLNKDFVRWVFISFMIATPLAYYFIQAWLKSFAYKTTFSWWIFALAGIITMGIALLTVSWQSWRAATRNPVDALRYE